MIAPAWREGATPSELAEHERIERAMALHTRAISELSADKHRLVSRAFQRMVRRREKAARKHGGG